MNSIKKHIPISLVILRGLIGFLLIYLSVIKIEHYSIYAVSVLVVGLLSDIFDGILARKWGVATELIRRLDSSIDLVFFVCIVIATYIQCPFFFQYYKTSLIALFGFEALTYVVCYIRFKKEIATHTIGAKFWTLFVVATLIQLMLQADSGWLYIITFWFGMLTRLEILLIVQLLPKWTSDVPSLYHAIQLCKGKEIKRNKLFN